MARKFIAKTYRCFGSLPVRKVVIRSRRDKNSASAIFPAGKSAVVGASLLSIVSGKIRCTKQCDKKFTPEEKLVLLSDRSQYELVAFQKTGHQYDEGDSGNIPLIKYITAYITCAVA